MKTLQKLTVVIVMSLSSLFAKEVLSLGNEVKTYDKIFEKIAEKRLGVDVTIIDKMENPFIVLRGTEGISDENNVSTQPIYILEAILADKAKINGMWYKKNDEVGNLKISRINRDSVVLQNELEKKELSIRTKDDSNFKISYK